MLSATGGASPPPYFVPVAAVPCSSSPGVSSYPQLSKGDRSTRAEKGPLRGMGGWHGSQGMYKKTSSMVLGLLTPYI